MRLADGLIRSTIARELSDERQAELVSKLQARTEELAQAQLRLRDPEADDFPKVEPDSIGGVPYEPER